MIEYPRDYLPLPLREGYAFQAVSPLQRTEMQSGRARQRRRFTSVPTMASVAWIFDDVQAQLFEAWFEDALKSGSEWFDCPSDARRRHPKLCRALHRYLPGTGAGRQKPLAFYRGA